MSFVLVIIGLFLFIGLVVAHEFGHFIYARRNGVEVEEFGIGFPPKIWGKKTKKGFIFSINCLPLGGFVRLKGEHDADETPGSFGAATTWAKTKIMAAGIGMNLLVAFVMLIILAWIGMPQLIDNQFTIAKDTHIVRNELFVGAIQSSSPASKAGLQSTDQIVGAWTGANLHRRDCIYPTLGATGSQGSACSSSSISPLNSSFTSAASLMTFTKQHAGQTVEFLIRRNGMPYVTKPVVLLSDVTVQASQKTTSPKGYFGIAPNNYTLQRSTWSAPIVALGLMKQFTILTFEGLGKALAGFGSIIAGTITGNSGAREAGQTAASAQVSGPVGIFAILKDGSFLGYQFMLMIIAVISLSLAIMNVLPIPALDGGKLFVTYISRLFRKRVSEKVEDYVYGVSFMFLLALMAVITIVDVKRFF